MYFTETSVTMIFKHAFCFANEIVPIVHGGVGDVDLLAHAAQLVDLVAQFFRVKVKAVALHGGSSSLRA